MGQVCAISGDEHKLDELKRLLEQQQAEKAALEEQLKEERDRQVRVETIFNQEIEKLKNEKKSIFIEMLKEKKKRTKVEDDIQKYIAKSSKIESQIEEMNDRSSTSYVSSDDDGDDEEDQESISRKKTLMLDADFDPISESKTIYSWIHDQS